MSTKKITRWMIPVFFLILAVFGLLQSPDYGKPIDETTEQAILRSNIVEYALRFHGKDSSFTQAVSQYGDEPISLSIEKDHGQCAYYPIAFLLWTMADSPVKLSAYWHAYTFLWFMLGVIAVYGFCRNIGLTPLVSLMGSLLMYISPRIYGEAHYNSKDIILLSLFVIVLWMGIRLMKKQSFLRAVLFSLFGAMCLNTRIIGFLPWGLMGILLIIKLCVQHAWNKESILAAIVSVLSMIAFYLLLTPASWSGVPSFLRYLFIESSSFSRWSGVVLFRGEFYDQTVSRLPYSYLFYMILVTLPLYILPLSAVGGVSLIREFIHSPKEAIGSEKWLSLVAATICTVLPLFYVTFSHTIVYNGWRHLYLTYSGIVLLGAQGIASVRNFLRKHGGHYGMHRVFAAGLTLFMAFTAYDMYRNHPYEYGYYNLLAHDGAVRQDMEMDWWCVSTDKAVQKLAAAERNTDLPLELSAQDDICVISLERSNYRYQKDFPVEIQTERRNTSYLLVNPMYSAIYKLSEPEGYHPLFEINSYGANMCVLYEKD